MKDELRDYLSEFRNRDVSYIPNPGNAGDSVMAAATYQCLDQMGIAYTTPHLGTFDPKGKIILYGGGGNLYSPERFSSRTLSRLHRQARHLTILPHTIKDVDALLDDFGENVTVICREQVSFDYVKGRNGRYRSLLMDDLAFSLDVDRLLNDGARHGGLSMLAHGAVQKILKREAYTSLDNMLRALRPRLPQWVRDHRGGGTLTCFRLDGESTGIALPPDNVDLSQVFMFGVAPAPVAFHAARSLFRTLLKFDEIRTDRLHVAISSALLGKRVLFHANNYYKSRAVYDYSIKGRFPKVQWMG